MSQLILQFDRTNAGYPCTPVTGSKLMGGVSGEKENDRVDYTARQVGIGGYNAREMLTYLS